MKNRGFLHNITSAVIMAVFVSFGVMTVYWLCSGMRLGMQKCIPVLTISCVVLVTLFAAIAVIFTAVDMKRISAVSEIRRCDGYTKEYYKALSEYITHSHMPHHTGILTFACALADGERFSQAEKLLEEIDPDELNGDEQDSYSNTLLYCAVMQKNKEKAEEIFDENRETFDKAVKRKKWYIVHTIGLFYQLKGDYGKAREYFENAKQHSRDNDLSFECESAICSVNLLIGEKKAAKQHCVECSRYADSITQVKRLRRLMKAVESAYK